MNNFIRRLTVVILATAILITGIPFNVLAADMETGNISVLPADNSAEDSSAESNNDTENTDNTDNTDNSTQPVPDITPMPGCTHSFTVISTDENNHCFECSVCKEILWENHTGGNTTCTQKAICEICGTEYGEFVPHTPAEITAIAATCTQTGLTAGEKCTVCGNITKEQTETEKLPHNFIIQQSDSQYHWHKCETCAETTEKEQHSGPVATCVQKSVCDICNTQFGRYSKHIYTGSDEICSFCKQTALIAYGTFSAYNSTEEDFRWTLNYDGKLVITCLSDKTELPDYDESDRPWASYAGDIKSVSTDSKITKIGSFAFYYCENLETINLSHNITSIGAYSFYSCKNLKNFVLPQNLTYTGYKAFADCDSLTDITIPKSLSFAESCYNLFSGCDRLETVTFQNGTTKIPAGILRECAGVKNINIPSTVKHIGYEAFAECTALEKIILPDSVDSVPYSLFAGCVALKQVKLPLGIEHIDGNVFKDCTSLEKIEIPYGVRTIGSRAFENCTSLKEIIIPEIMDVSQYEWYGIGYYAFANCDSLASFTLPGQIQYIGAGAFYSCDNLKTILLNNSLSSIGGSAFADCTNLQKVYIFPSTATIAGKAFDNCPQLKFYGISDSYAGTYAKENNIPFVQFLFAPIVTITPNPKYNNKPQLKWNEIAGAEKYEIYRSEKQGDLGAKMLTTANKSYTNTSAEPGKTYYYTVRAIKGTLASDYSTALKFTVEKDMLDTPVVTITPNPKYNNKPQLKWNEIAGAEKYEIYRSEKQGDLGAKMLTTANKSYTNTSAEPGKTYYYTVRAISSVKNSDYSTPVKFTVEKDKLDTPVVTITPNAKYSGKPQLKWAEVDGATEYEIYRSETKTGFGTKPLYTTKNKSYTNTSAEPGKTYYYTVRAISSVKNSDYSTPVKFTVEKDKLATPVVTITPNPKYSGKPQLKWAEVDGATGYEIFRSTSENGFGTKPLYTTKNKSYTNTSAVTGKNYYYKVRAVKGTQYSDYSTVIKFTVK